MLWTVQTAGELARYDCEICGGSGVRTSGLSSQVSSTPAGNRQNDDSPVVPCDCACRRVFRDCYRRFRQCAAADGSSRRISFGELPKGVDRHQIWYRKNEDYCADFTSAGRRCLSAELYRVFRFYHLLGGSAELVARRVGLSLREMTRLLTEVEITVGREFALMQPYSLYPPRQYMTGVVSPRIA